MKVNMRHFGILTFVFTISVAWFFVCVMVLISYLPRNAVTFAYIPKLLVKTFLPEGWNFFTRNPREELVFLLKKDDDGQWRKYNKSNNGDGSNLFGLKKDARAIGSEYGLMFSRKNISWKECESGSPDCYNEDTSIIEVENKLGKRLLCGEFLFILRQQIPWAWSKSDVNLPYKYLKVKFQCQ